MAPGLKVTLQDIMQLPCEVTKGNILKCISLQRQSCEICCFQEAHVFWPHVKI